ncbi:hypothetical protein HNQ34_002308 [Anoxybacillus tepidamans]|uniref:DUF4376 domain-containing protein n=1 Tax=Anoxybacteroides tepidamans TaxID=265948 RepID=A0A7W8IR32_9BACL|nr:hypothetical protein [Anoxybacillus tepidamans]MBB5325208.1 hypothetical protein [Anoxybacillus tepidamans]
MKKVLIFDINGNYVEDKIVDDEYIPQKNEFACSINTVIAFYKPKLVNGQVVEGLTQAEIDKLKGNTLEDAKARKLKELNDACNKAIIDGFDYTINGVLYRFSCSLEAQANFQGTDTLFKDGLITSISWTVTNKVTGKIERIAIDKTTFTNLRLAVFNHINTQISKLRDTLQPKVEQATTIAEVEAVVWS